MDPTMPSRPPAPLLACRDLVVRYGAFEAVDGVDLDAHDGEVVAVLGPSGCGKSTLLRAIAGLEPLAGGAIRLAGDDLAGRRPDQRDVGLMFQDHALFPHRSVADNVAFGPRMRGVRGAELRRRVDEALTLVALDGFGDRRVTELSGGEQQRVALARALAPRPRLLMLDEPLGSLDRALRDQLLEQLPRVFAGAGCTVLYVTHDQDEALTLADRVAVMRGGRLVQTDRPDRLWRAPRDRFVAGFLGLDVVLDGEVLPGGRLRTALGDLPVAGLPTSGAASVVVLPEALRLAGDGMATHGQLAGDGPQASGELVVSGRVEGRRFAGDHTVVTVVPDPAGAPPLRVPLRGVAAPAVGDRVVVALDPSGLHPLR
jgi:thiamine transport system ATP-binding protein